MTLNRTDNYHDTSGAWHTQWWFGGFSGTAGIYHRSNDFDAVMVDETVTWSDGVTRNPFAASAPGLLDIEADYTSPVTASTSSQYGTVPYSQFPYSGGILSGLGKFHMDYGLYQIIAKMAAGPGSENGFGSYSFGDFPNAKTTTLEIDFGEIYYNGTSWIWAMSTHIDPTASGTKTGKTIYCVLPFDASAGFHTYSVDVSVANGIRGWYDDTQATFHTTPGGSTVATLDTPSNMALVYPWIIHDVDKTSSPVWGGNASTPSSYPKHLQAQAVRAFRNSDTTAIGGASALISLP